MIQNIQCALIFSVLKDPLIYRELFRLSIMRRAVFVAAAGLTAGVGTGLALQYRAPHQALSRTGSAAIHYPASVNFPDLSKHNNVMAKVLTPAVRKKKEREKKRLTNRQVFFYLYCKL